VCVCVCVCVHWLQWMLDFMAHTATARCGIFLCVSWSQWWSIKNGWSSWGAVGAGVRLMCRGTYQHHLAKSKYGWMVHAWQQCSNDQLGCCCCTGRSTAHAVIALLQALMSCLDTGWSVHTVFVNFHKSIYLVNHSPLFDKLQSTGIPNSYLSSLAST